MSSSPQGIEARRGELLLYCPLVSREVRSSLCPYIDELRATSALTMLAIRAASEAVFSAASRLARVVHGGMEDEKDGEQRGEV